MNMMSFTYRAIKVLVWVYGVALAITLIMALSDFAGMWPSLLNAFSFFIIFYTLKVLFEGVTGLTMRAMYKDHLEEAGELEEK